MAAFWISLADPLAQTPGVKVQIANTWVTHRHTEEALQMKVSSSVVFLTLWRHGSPCLAD